MSGTCTFATPANTLPVPLTGLDGPAGLVIFAPFRSKLWNEKSSRGAMGSWCRFSRTNPWPLNPVLNASFASLTGTLTPPPRPTLTRRPDTAGSICARAADARQQATKPTATHNDRCNVDDVMTFIGSTPSGVRDSAEKRPSGRLSLGEGLSSAPEH